VKTRSAKAKGRRLQNLLTEKLRELFPHLNPADIKPALMGESGIDIKLSTAARKDIPYGFESKNVEALNIWSAIAQAEANATSEELTPAVIFARNRMPEPYVAVPLNVFLRLLLHDSWERRIAAAKEGEKKIGAEMERLGVDEMK
jgi:hypothetical protein